MWDKIKGFWNKRIDFSFKGRTIIGIVSLIFLIAIILLISLVGKFGFTFEFKDNFMEFNDNHDWFWSYVLSCISVVIAVVTIISLWSQIKQLKKQVETQNKDHFNKYLVALTVEIDQAKLEHHFEKEKPRYIKFLPGFCEIKNNSDHIASDVEIICELKNSKEILKEKFTLIIGQKSKTINKPIDWDIQIDDDQHYTDMVITVFYLDIQKNKYKSVSEYSFGWKDYEIIISVIQLQKYTLSRNGDLII